VIMATRPRTAFSMRFTWRVTLLFLLIICGLGLLALSADAHAAEFGLTVRVVRWDEPSGKLVVFLPMHNLELECAAATSPTVEHAKAVKPIRAGEYYRAAILEHNGLFLNGPDRVFAIKRMTLK